MPAGSFANAASVGAKTVNGPLPLSVSARPAACTAATRVLKSPAATAVSTIVACAAGRAAAGAFAGAFWAATGEVARRIEAAMVSSMCFLWRFNGV